MGFVGLMRGCLEVTMRAPGLKGLESVNRKVFSRDRLYNLGSARFYQTAIRINSNNCGTLIDESYLIVYPINPSDAHLPQST
jgi:hypothetical protein